MFFRLFPSAVPAFKGGMAAGRESGSGWRHARLPVLLLLLSGELAPRRARAAAGAPRCMSPYEHPSGYETPPARVSIAELCHPTCQSFYDVMRSLVDTQPECSSMELGGMLMNVLCSECGKPLWPVVESGDAADLGGMLRGAACASQPCTAAFQSLVAHLSACNSFRAPLPAALVQLATSCAAPAPASHAHFAELARHLPDAWFGASFGRRRGAPTCTRAARARRAAAGTRALGNGRPRLRARRARAGRARARACRSCAPRCAAVPP